MGCSQSVSNILKKPRLTGSVKDLKISVEEKENYGEDRIMVRKACPIVLRLDQKIIAEIQIEHGESVSTSTTRLRLKEAGLNNHKPSIISATSEQSFLTASVFTVE